MIILTILDDHFRVAKQRTVKEACAAGALEKERKAAREQAQSESNHATQAVEPLNTSGMFFYRSRLNPLTRVQSESLSGEERLIYQPGISPGQIVLPLQVIQ